MTFGYVVNPRIRSRYNFTWTNLYAYFLILPLIVFALPMGAGNSITQPLALLLLAPYILLSPRGILASLAFMVFISVCSYIQYQRSVSLDHSIYQAFRSGIPFFYLCALLFGRRDIFIKLKSIMSSTFKDPNLVITIAIYFYLAGQIIQTVLFRFGIPLANASSSSENERVLLFPASLTIIIFYLGCFKKNILILLMSLVVILATGSKAAIGAAVVVAFIAFAQNISIKSILSYTIGSIMIISAGYYINPLAAQRVHDFVSSDGAKDVTRDWEIYHAKRSFHRDYTTTMLGNGLSQPLTPGIRSLDPKWSQNSKFDIENGYWSMISKLGIIGLMVFGLFMFRAGRDSAFIAVLGIWCVFCLKTSYQFFTTFDGSFLIVGSVLVLALMYSTKHTRNINNSHRNIPSYGVRR